MNTKKLKRVCVVIWTTLKKIRALIICTYYITRYGETEGYKKITERVMRNISKMPLNKQKEELKKYSGLFKDDENDS